MRIDIELVTSGSTVEIEPGILLVHVRQETKENNATGCMFCTNINYAMLPEKTEEFLSDGENIWKRIEACQRTHRVLNFGQIQVCVKSFNQANYEYKKQE